MLRTVVVEQLPGLAVMEIRAKMQTADIVSRTSIQHRLITLCWGCHQIVCNSCCASLCMLCPLFSGRHPAFLQRSWAIQLAERPTEAKKSMSTELAPKCPTCERLLCVLCDLGMCPGCLRPPKSELQPDVTDPPNDCPSCGRRLCSGCGRCECRRCQPELCRHCVRVRPHRCPVRCPGSELTIRTVELPELDERPEKSTKQNKGKQPKDKYPNAKQPPPTSVRCPACDRRCSQDLVARVFCCRASWRPPGGCAHGQNADQLRQRLELAVCSTAGESCDSEESSEPNGFAELVPPHCRIFTGQCKDKF